MNYLQRFVVAWPRLLVRQSNFGSIGVVVGAFSAVAPHRAPEIAQLGLRALAAATLSNSDECYYCRILYWFSVVRNL